jgi:hypothetical protein
VIVWDLGRDRVGATVGDRRLGRARPRHPAGSNPGSKVSATEPDSGQLKAALARWIPRHATRSFRLGAGRSQVQILSPRLDYPANGVVLRSGALGRAGCNAAAGVQSVHCDGFVELFVAGAIAAYRLHPAVRALSRRHAARSAGGRDRGLPGATCAARAAMSSRLAVRRPAGIDGAQPLQCRDECALPPQAPALAPAGGATPSNPPHWGVATAAAHARGSWNDRGERCVRRR